MDWGNRERARVIQDGSDHLECGEHLKGYEVALEEAIRLLNLARMPTTHMDRRVMVFLKRYEIRERNPNHAPD